MSGSSSGGAKAKDPAEIRERLVWRAAVLMLLAVAGWLYYIAFQAVERSEALEKELQAATVALEELDRSERQPGARRLGLSTAAVRRLEAAGVDNDPERYLFADLARYMERHDEELSIEDSPLQLVSDETVILSDRWVYAVFDSDAGRGAALLEYRLGPEGELDWRPLATVYPDEI